MKAKIEAILKFSRLSTPEMYDIVNKAWQTVKVNEAQLQEYASKLNLITTCATDSNINAAFQSLTGFYMGVSRLRFTHNTAQKRFLVWYAVRGTIPYYYPIIHATMARDTVKFKCSLNGYRKAFNLEHVREYQNGNNDFRATDDLLRLIHSVRTIHENMQGKRR